MAKFESSRPATVDEYDKYRQGGLDLLEVTLHRITLDLQAVWGTLRDERTEDNHLNRRQMVDGLTDLVDLMHNAQRRAMGIERDEA